MLNIVDDDDDSNEKCIVRYIAKENEPNGYLFIHFFVVFNVCRVTTNTHTILLANIMSVFICHIDAFARKRTTNYNNKTGMERLVFAKRQR